VLSADNLTRNLAALTRAQGTCPALGALRDSMRVDLSGPVLNVEVRTGTGDWLPLDPPGQVGAGDWLHGIGRETSQAILVGVGLGYALERAQQLGVKKVVALEPDPGLATLLLSRRDWREWFDTGRLRLLTGPDYRGAADTARFLDGLQDIPILSHPLRAQLEPESAARAAAVAERMAQNARSNGTARRRFAGPYLRQTLTNVPAIAREGDVQALTGAFPSVPAIVVGAGPSLDGNLAQLRAWQAHAVIVATDTTLGPLLAGGVTPHLVVGVDSSALNAQHLTTPAGGGDVMLAAEGSLHPSALERFAGRTFVFRVADHEPWPWLRAAGVDRGGLRAWGSVLTSAFDLACRMACDPIVFAGADLAFTGMRPYCRGTIYDAQWQEWIDKGCSWELLMEDYFSRQPELYRDDIHGVRTRTSPNLVSFRDWLVEQIGALRSGTVFNATGAGILHGNGIRQATLADALAGAVPRTGIREMLRSKHAASCAPAAIRDRLRAQLAHARHRPEALPLPRWVEFSAGTLSAEEILAAVPASLG
jgi:hypothetical protein